MVTLVDADMSQHTRGTVQRSLATILHPRISEDIGKALTATVLENLRNVDFEDDEVIAKDDN